MKIKIILLIFGVIVTAVVILMLGKAVKVKVVAPEVCTERTYVLVGGTTITCPKCLKPIWRITRNIRSSGLVSASQFIPASDDVPQPKEGKRTVCPFDGENLWGEIMKMKWVEISG